LLTECPFDPILLLLASKFVGIIYIMLVSVFITLFSGFLLGILSVEHRLGSCERVLLGSYSPPFGHLLGPSEVIVNFHQILDWCQKVESTYNSISVDQSSF
jgi:hypothetical protein